MTSRRDAIEAVLYGTYRAKGLPSTDRWELAGAIEAAVAAWEAEPSDAEREEVARLLHHVDHFIEGAGDAWESYLAFADRALRAAAEQRRAAGHR